MHEILYFARFIHQLMFFIVKREILFTYTKYVNMLPGHRFYFVDEINDPVEAYLSFITRNGWLELFFL